MRVLAAMVLVARAAWGQAAFEVASVKVHDFQPGSFANGTETGLNVAGNRVTVTGSMVGLAMAAYNVKAYQVSGGPAWTDRGGKEQWYDIEAKSPGDTVPTMEQARAMLQGLLAERFQLKVHREGRELPVYELTVGKGGPNLKESAAGAPPNTEMLPAARGLSHVKWMNLTMAQFVGRLAGNFDRPLFDRTRLTKGYDITLEWVRKMPEMTGAEAAALAERNVREGALPTEPTIERALQDQLGLRVVAAKAPVDIVVIDHVERPTGN